MNSRALSCSRKSGFILVSVLMLGLVLISCATAFTWFVRSQVRSVGAERLALSSRSMAQVLTGSITSLLAELAQHIGYDSPLQRWYQPLAVPTEDLGLWIVRITPLDDKIPLRNLFLPDGSTMRRELTQPWADMWDKLHHTELEGVILDFLDRNTRARVGSTEREGYLNRPLYDMSELMILSHDITPTILKGITDYCTLYSDGRINLNVAPVAVMELLPGLDTGGMAERVAQFRMDHPLESLNDVQSIPGAGPKISSQLTNIVTFKSRYFRIRIDIMNDETGGGHGYEIIIDRTSRQIVRWEES